MQKSKRMRDVEYRTDLFRSDLVSDGGLKDKFSKYYDSTTFNKSKTFRSNNYLLVKNLESLSFTKLNSFNQSDNTQRISGTFNRTSSEFGKFMPYSTKNIENVFNRDSKTSSKEKNLKSFSPDSQHVPNNIKTKRLFMKNHSNKIQCSLRLNNDKEDHSKRYSSCDNEAENKKKVVSKSLNAENKSPLIINNYFINSSNSPNIAYSIKDEKRLLTIEEKIDMMTKLVKTKEEIIIKQVRSELIQREKEKNSKIQKKINYLSDRNMLENIQDEIKPDNHTIPNECPENRLLSIRSANLEDKMRFRVKSASLLNFKIDKKQIFKPRVDSIEYLKKIFNKKKIFIGGEHNKTLRKSEIKYVSNSFLKSASREKYRAVTVDSKGFRETNYNSTYKSARNLKNEISDFIRKKNREHKEKAIKLKDQENENLIKKYIELMNINNIIERSNKNFSSRISKSRQVKEVKKNDLIKNEMYIGNKLNKKKNPNDSSFLDYNQYYINILESRLILDPQFNIQKLASASGVSIDSKELKIVKNKGTSANIKTYRPKSSDRIEISDGENKINESVKKISDRNKRPQTNKDFIDFLNKKESEIKAISNSSGDRLEKGNLIDSKLMDKSSAEYNPVIASTNDYQEKLFLSEEGKANNNTETLPEHSDNLRSLAREESKRERPEHRNKVNNTRINAKNIKSLKTSILMPIRHKVFASLKQFTASSYLTEHYIYSFNYLDALNDVFMAKNISFAFNQINQYANIKKIYQVLNVFTIPTKRNTFARLKSISELVKMNDEEEIEVYHIYLNLFSLFAKRDAFSKIKEHATKIELEEYDDDEEKLMEIYKYMLNKLTMIVNKRYFSHFITGLSSERIKPKIINDNRNNELDQNEGSENTKNDYINKSNCSKDNTESNRNEKSLNSSRDKMKKFSVNKFDKNNSDSANLNLSASRIKHHTYLHESLSEKSCLLECNSFQSPKLHRIYMLIEEQKKANQISGKNGKENSDNLIPDKNNLSESQENISKYILDLQDGNMEISNKNISMIEEVLSEERESLERLSQIGLNTENNPMNSLSLLDSIKYIDTENKLEENKEITHGYDKGKSEIDANKSYEEISDFINSIKGKSNKLKNSREDFQEDKNKIRENPPEKSEILMKSLDNNGDIPDSNKDYQSDKNCSAIGLNSELVNNLEKSKENRVNSSGVESLNNSILSSKEKNDNSLSRKCSDAVKYKEMIKDDSLEINSRNKSYEVEILEINVIEGIYPEIKTADNINDVNNREEHTSFVENPAINIVDNQSPFESPIIPVKTDIIPNIDPLQVTQESPNPISKHIDESFKEAESKANLLPNLESNSINLLHELDELADLLSDEILKDLLSLELSYTGLIPKKSFTFSKDNRVNQSSNISSFYNSNNSLSNLHTTESTPTSMFNKTILEQKTEETKTLYEQKILPELMEIIKEEIKCNYTEIVSSLKMPFAYDSNNLLQNLVKEPTTNIKKNFLKLPVEVEDEELLPRIKLLNQLEPKSKSIMKEYLILKDCSEYGNIINDCVIEAAEEILKKERLYGEQGVPLVWSSRTRATAFKYTSSEISKKNLVNFFEEDFKNIYNTKMGLIQENNEDLDFEQINAEKEKRIIQSLSKDVYY